MNRSDNGEKKFGKFASAEDVYKAYTTLEAEFTKKCQKLKELEKVYVKYTKQNEIPQDSENPDNVYEKYTNTDKIPETPAENDEVYVKYTIPRLTRSASAVALAPLKKPRTLEEAKKLAETLFGGV